MALNLVTGAGNRMTVGSAPAVISRPDANFTITGWYKATSIAAALRLLTFVDSSGGANYENCGIAASGYPFVGNGASSTSVASNPIAAGTWLPLLFSRSGTTLKIALGARTQTGTYASTLPGGAVTELLVGHTPYGGITVGLGGAIAALKMWDALLTDAEIAREQQYYQPIRTTNLKFALPLHDLATARFIAPSPGTVTAPVLAGSYSFTADNLPVAWQSPIQIIPFWRVPLFHTISVDENVTVSDDVQVAIEGGAGALIEVTETVAVTDVVGARHVVGDLQVGDNIAVSDVPLGVATLPGVTANENVTVADAGVQVVLAPSQASASDTVSVATVPILATAPLTVSLTESVTVSENAVASGALYRTAIENVTVSDAAQVVVSTAQVSLAESVTVSDSLVAVALNRQVTAQESVTVTESAAARLDPLRVAVNENVTLTETLLVNGGGGGLLFAEQITVSDVPLLAVPIPGRQFSESVTVSESAQVAVVRTVSQTETVTVSDTFSIVVARQVAAAESVAVSDGAPQVVVSTAQVNRTETVTVSESIALRVSREIAKTETVTVSESVQIQYAPALISVSDTVTVTDQPLFGSVRQVFAQENIGVSDVAAVRVSTPLLAANENVAVSDTGVKVVFAPNQIAVSETVTVTESVLAERLAAGIRPSETVTVTESVQVAVSTPLLVANENVAVSDELAMRLPVILPLRQETIGVTDSLFKIETTPLRISLNENVTVTETRQVSLSALSSRLIGAEQTVTVTDTVQVAVQQTWLSINKSETVTVTDVPAKQELAIFINVRPSGSLYFPGAASATTYRAKLDLQGDPPADVGNGTNFTYEFVLRCNKAQNTTTGSTVRQSNIILDHEVSGFSGGWQLGVTNVGDALVVCFGVAGDAFNWNTIFSDTDIGDGQDHHIALEWDAGTARIYVDGVLQTEGVYTVYNLSVPNFAAPDAIPNNTSLIVGGSKRGAGWGAYTGTFAQFRISDTARYAGEDYQPPFWIESDPNTVALFTFTEGTGTVANDTSGLVTAPDMTLLGTAGVSTPSWAGYDDLTGESITVTDVPQIINPFARLTANENITVTASPLVTVNNGILYLVIGETSSVYDEVGTPTAPIIIPIGIFLFENVVLSEELFILCGVGGLVDAIVGIRVVNGAHVRVNESVATDFFNGVSTATQARVGVVQAQETVVDVGTLITKTRVRNRT